MSNDKLREAAQRILDHFYAPDGVYQPIDNTRRREFERLMRKLGAALADTADAPEASRGPSCAECGGWLWKASPQAVNPHADYCSHFGEPSIRPDSADAPRGPWSLIESSNLPDQWVIADAKNAMYAARRVFTKGQMIAVRDVLNRFKGDEK